MGQSLAKIYLHIIFSTKNRQTTIPSDVEKDLYSYLGGICNSLECFPVKIGGYHDHVHILCVLSKKVLVIKLLEELKSHSSKWMKTKGDVLKNFYWQDGYGAFSIGQSQLEHLKSYIENQHQHHRSHTFQDEYRKFLVDYQVQYDERYVWD